MTKFYGSSRGVSGLSLEVEAGEVFGFLSANGAGKTTTIRLMLDLIRPSSGRIELLGDRLAHSAAGSAHTWQYGTRRSEAASHKGIGAPLPRVACGR
ncbi:MAG: ATP-binding cassette domain-containing protein [Gaiellaceae bacterium]